MQHRSLGLYVCMYVCMYVCKWGEGRRYIVTSRLHQASLPQAAKKEPTGFTCDHPFTTHQCYKLSSYNNTDKKWIYLPSSVRHSAYKIMEAFSSQTTMQAD